jgi:hypothetical protein
MPETSHEPVARAGRLSGRRLLTLCVALVLAALTMAYLVIAPRLKLEAYHRQLIRRGEKLTVSDLINPVPPKAVLAASRFLHLAQQLPVAPPAEHSGPPAGMAYVSPGLAMAGWQQTHVPVRFHLHPPPGSEPPLAPPTWVDLDREIAPHRDLLREIHACLADGPFDWNLDYHLGPALMSPHLAPQKRVAQWFIAIVSNDLHARRLQSVHNALLAQSALVRQREKDATLISQLVGTALGTMAFGSTWEAWQADGWSDSQLNELQAAWSRLRFLEPTIRSMEMERAMGRVAFDQCRRDVTQLPQFTGGLEPIFPLETPLGALLDGLPFNGSGIIDDLRLRLWRWRWSYADERVYLESCQADLDTLRGPGQLHSKLASLQSLENQRTNLDARILASDLLFPSSLAVEKAAAAECLRSMVIAALALKRHQLAHAGPYPDTLEQLVPRFISELPTDPFDGQPLRYRREAMDRFTLYSIGVNGVDDGGDPTPPASRARARSFIVGLDLVWPWPAPMDEDLTPPTDSDPAALPARVEPLPPQRAKTHD